MWVFDVNRRVYDKRDKSVGGTLIWREHWVKKSVIGETKLSWLVGHSERLATKVPKRGPLPRGMLLNECEVDEAVWINDNRYRLSEYVRDCRDFVTLKQIADLVGFEEKKRA